MAIATAILANHCIRVYNTNGAQIFSIPGPTGSSGGPHQSGQMGRREAATFALHGYTSASVTVISGHAIHTYNEQGQLASTLPHPSTHR